MKVYADNDIIHKLAAFGLLDETLHFLEITHSDIYVLITAKYKFRINKRDKGAKRYGEETHGRICKIIASVNKLSNEPPSATVDCLGRSMGIDAGEAILFAAAAEDPQALILTGDKKALCALATSGANEIVEQLAGRILCLEQIVAGIMDATSFEFVRDAVSKERDIDTTMKIVFSNGTMTAESDARQGLGSYTDNLRADTGDLLRSD
jgi:hypothetical protein